MDSVAVNECRPDGTLYHILRTTERRSATITKISPLRGLKPCKGEILVVVVVEIVPNINI